MSNSHTIKSTRTPGDLGDAVSDGVPGVCLSFEGKRQLKSDLAALDAKYRKIGFKHCKSCGNSFPASEFFNSDRSRSDGFNRECKSCIRKRRLLKKEQGTSRKDAGVTYIPGKKWCRGCEKQLPLREFEKSNGSRDGLKVRCIACNQERYR